MAKILWAGDSAGGNYTDRLLDAAASARAGKVTHFEVQHDEWCALLGERGPCNCDPVVIAKAGERGR